MVQNPVNLEEFQPILPSEKRVASRKLMPLLLGVLMAGATLSKILIGSLAALGYGCLALLLFGSVFWFFVRNNRNPLPALLFPLLRTELVLLLIYLVSLFHGFDGEGLVIIGELVGITIFFVAMSLVDWSNQYLQRFTCVISPVGPGYALVWFATGHEIATLAGVVHSNIVGTYAFHTAVIQVFAAVSARTKGWRAIFIVLALLGLAIVVVTETRSLWIATFFGLLTFGSWKFLASRPRLFSLYFLVMVSIVLGFTYVYPHLKHFAGADAANNSVAASSGKSLFSGRDRLWGILSSVTFKEPILGYGAGAIAQTFIAQSDDPVTDDADLSAHNLWIQIALQTGFLGLAVYLAVLWQVWRLFWVGRSNLYARISAAYMIGMLFYETFEITLTQNKLTVGTFQWLILAVGVSKCLEVYTARQSPLPSLPAQIYPRASSLETGASRV